MRSENPPAASSYLLCSRLLRLIAAQINFWMHQLRCSSVALLAWDEFTGVPHGTSLVWTDSTWSCTPHPCNANAHIQTRAPFLAHSTVLVELHQQYQALLLEGHALQHLAQLLRMLPLPQPPPRAPQPQVSVVCV